MADDKQEILSDTDPPAGTPGNEGYRAGHGVSPGYQSRPGYPSQGPPGYPPQVQPGYLPQGPPGYPVQVQPGYPSQSQPGYGYPTGTQQPMPAGAMATHNFTVVQTGGPTVVAAVFPPDHCFLSWFACLFCCWPLGICAIMNSNNARDAINRGDLASASAYSQMARKYASWSIGCGIVLIILIIVLLVWTLTTTGSRTITSSSSLVTILPPTVR